MAKSSSARARQAREAARSAGSNPYVRRLIEDEELRGNVRDAFDAARHAYQRMSNGKGPVKAITEDKKVQRDLRQAAESLRDASDQLRGKRKHRRWGPGDRAQRGFAEDGARSTVRRRGGVRVQLHNDPGR
jgi:hypothetical protein